MPAFDWQFPVTLLLARVLWSASCRDHPELRAIKRQKVARHIDKKFGAAGYTEANSRVRAIEEIRAVLDGRVDAILRWQAAIRSDNAGLGDIGPRSQSHPRSSDRDPLACARHPVGARTTSPSEYLGRFDAITCRIRTNSHSRNDLVLTLFASDGIDYHRFGWRILLAEDDS
jgi:hypothetical protein